MKFLALLATFGLLNFLNPYRWKFWVTCILGAESGAFSLLDWVDRPLLRSLLRVSRLWVYFLTPKRLIETPTIINILRNHILEGTLGFDVPTRCLAQNFSEELLIHGLLRCTVHLPVLLQKHLRFPGLPNRVRSTWTCIWIGYWLFKLITKYFLRWQVVHLAGVLQIRCRLVIVKVSLPHRFKKLVKSCSMSWH